MNPKVIDTKKSITAMAIPSATPVSGTFFCCLPAVSILREAAASRQDTTARPAATVFKIVVTVSSFLMTVIRNAETIAAVILLSKRQAAACPACTATTEEWLPANRGSKKNFGIFFALSPACTTFAYK